MSLSRLLQLLKPYRALIGLNIFCNIMVALFTIVSIPAFIPFLQLLLNLQPKSVAPTKFGWSMSDFFGYCKYKFSLLLQEQGSEKALLYICILLIILFLLKNIFRYFSLFFLAPVRLGVIRDLRNSMFDKFLKLPLSYYSEQKKGDLITRITSDVAEVEWSILTSVEALFRQPLIIVGCLIFMIYVSPYLTMFVLVLLVFTAVIIGGISKSLKKQSDKAQGQQGGLIAQVEESLSGLKVIQGFNAEKLVNDKFIMQNNEHRDTAVRVLWRRELASPMSEFLGVSVFAILLWFGAKLVFKETLGPETFLAFLMAFFYIIEPAKSLSTAQYNLTKGGASLDRIDQILNTEEIINKNINAPKIEGFNKKISLSNVFFKYQGAKEYAINDVSIDIEKGKHVAIVGASGSGKSTLVDLIARFYDIDAGRLTIDGMEINKLNLKEVRSLFGVVTQEPILFHDTIYNNIALGVPDVARADIIRAAKLAYAHDFIEATEQGYETIIGDRGMKLSGGERQRITLARAVLKDPPILILDEATSALDSESEAMIQKAFTEVLKNRTAIIIAHRLSTIQHCDEIIVMKDGKIVERGSHEELIEKGGDYSKFAAIQLG